LEKKFKELGLLSGKPFSKDMPKHAIILKFCIEIDIPFTRTLFNTNSTLYYSFSHFPIKPHLKSYFIIDSDTLLEQTERERKKLFFRSTTVRLTAYSSQNYSTNINKPYYISLFLSCQAQLFTYILHSVSYILSWHSDTKLISLFFFGEKNSTQHPHK
jgi:hypothetical protein